MVTRDRDHRLVSGLVCFTWAALAIAGVPYLFAGQWLDVGVRWGLAGLVYAVWLVAFRWAR